MNFCNGARNMTPDSPLDAVVITNQVLWNLFYTEQTDYRPRILAKGITLNDYQGSILDISLVAGLFCSCHNPT